MSQEDNVFLQQICGAYEGVEEPQSGKMRLKVHGGLFIVASVC